MSMPTSCTPDPFGQALWGAHSGRPARLIFHRDDGLVSEQDAALYLAGPDAFDSAEAAGLAAAKGCVLDIGCGAGRHALVLEERGLAVVGLDVSPLALEVARRRGLRHTVWASAAALPFAAASFDAFLLLGNNLGIGGTLEGTVAMPGCVAWPAREASSSPVAGTRRPRMTLCIWLITSAIGPADGPSVR